MLTLSLTREELIEDLPIVFREQNNITSMNNDDIIDAWKRWGTHVGTWDWDEINIWNNKRWK